MNIVDKCTKLIQKVLRPSHCYLCDSINNQPILDVCTDCISELPHINQSCNRCALPLNINDSPVCGKCLSNPPSYDVLLSQFEYQFPIDKFITELKFHKKLYNAATLGHLFSDFIKTRATPLPECIIPVPLHPKRLQQRGYNQALEIARVVSKNLNIPIDQQLCKRVINTKPQSDLSADKRHDNIKNAFEINQLRQYNHVALFDDVVTTGHTVEALTTLLRQHHIKVIQVWSVARVKSQLM
jgi:ComF family protein